MGFFFFFLLPCPWACQAESGEENKQKRELYEAGGGGEEADRLG